MRALHAFSASLLLTAFLPAPFAVSAQELQDKLPQTFADLPPAHPAYTAVEFLVTNGVIKGYDDGTFRPENPVNRAEALKLILTPHLTTEELLQAAQSPSPFSDIVPPIWYHPYAVAAIARGIIDGPPDKERFYGSHGVILAEFLKMLQLSFGIDPAGDFGDIRVPLAEDVSNPEAWYYPYMRYALASSMITALVDGRLYPAQELTRSDAAMLVFSLIAYREGIRTPILLQIAEGEVQGVLSRLSGGDTEGARLASARAIVAARGAIARSEDAKAKGTMKITEAFAAIVRSVGIGKVGQFKDAEAAAKEAWNLAGRARAFSEDLDLAASLAQEIATNLAQEARSALGQGIPEGGNQ
jgi:hypothetical protein